jgi:TPR repeat protein
MKSKLEAEMFEKSVTCAVRQHTKNRPDEPRAPLNVFFSYSHRDEEFRDGLDKHLRLLQRRGLISSWYDGRIEAGAQWNEEINFRLRSADVVLILVSADFLASDYCFDIELQCALNRHNAGEALVIPVLVRPVDWSGAPFAKLQAVPRDGRAIAIWPDRDEALMNVAQAVRDAVHGWAAKDSGAKRANENRMPLPKPDQDLRRQWRVLFTMLAAAILGCAVWTTIVDRAPNIVVKESFLRGKDLYLQQNYTAAARYLKQAADNGSTEAADSLGLMAEYGLGAHPDCKAAKKWFERGVKGNSSNAMDHMGLLFEHGCGVKLDNGEAKRWFERAANLGNSDAMNNLGWMYANDLGVGTNYAKAMAYFREAAAYQNGDAMNNIGWLYQKGLGVAKPDLREANEWFRKAAKANSTLGMNSLGYAYEQGSGLPNRDYRKAMEWFQKAARAGTDLGSSWAMNNIGDIYERGYLGVPDKSEAVRWYRKSAENGFSRAKSNLARLGENVPEGKPCCPINLS